MSWRPLEKSDFHNQDVIRATYNGNNRYLTKGREYYVTFNERSQMATVQLGYNPDMIHSNGGVQFPVGTFLVEEENKVAVKLSDLSLEDREALLQQAREKIEKENIEKNAVAMYAMKKKELMDNTVNELANTLRLKSGPPVTKCRDRFVHMTNYLYALNRPNVNSAGSNVTKIATAEDWALFQDICKKVHECMVHCVKYDNITRR